MTGLIESLEKAITKLYRKRISKRLFDESSRSVLYGPFKNMKLIPFSHLSSAPLAQKLFGFYEPQVVEFLASQKGKDTLVNLGAGEGYYSIGLLMTGTVKRALSFEIEERGRKAILQNAQQNGIHEGIEVFGAADANLLSTLLAQGIDPKKTILLCDIEGIEFSVIDEKLIAALSGATYVIELHHFMFQDGEAKVEKLKRMLAPNYDLEIVKAKPMDWYGIPELEALHDNARALVTSDGRKKQGIWLFARPKV